MDPRHTFLLTLKGDQPRSFRAGNKKNRPLSVTVGAATSTAIPSHLLNKQTSKRSSGALNSSKDPLMAKSRNRRSANTSDKQERSSSMRHTRSDANAKHTLEVEEVVSRIGPRVSFALSSEAHEKANGLTTDSQQQIYTSGAFHGGDRGCCCGGVPPLYPQPFQPCVVCPCMTASPLSATLPFSSAANLSSMNGAAVANGAGVVHVVPPSVPISQGAKEMSTASHPPCSSALLCQPQRRGRNSTDACSSGPPLHVVDIAKITLEQKIAALEAETAAAQHQLNEKEVKRKELFDMFDREKQTLADLRSTVDKTVATIHTTRKINVDCLNSINARDSQAMVEGQSEGGSSPMSPELLAIRLADKYMRSQYYTSSITSITGGEGRRRVVEKPEHTNQASHISEKDARKRALGHDEVTALPSAMAMTPHLTLGDLEGLVEALRVRLACAREEADSLSLARSGAIKRTNEAREATERLYSINATLEAEVCRLRDVVLKKRTAERSAISKQIRSMQTELESCQSRLEKADAETRDVTRETLVFVTRKERHDAAIKGVLAEHDSLLKASQEVKEKAAERQLAIDSLTAENTALRQELTVRSLTRPVDKIEATSDPSPTCTDSAVGLSGADGRTDDSLCRCISGKFPHSNNARDDASNASCAAEGSGTSQRRVCVLCRQPVCAKQQLIGRGRCDPKSSEEDAVLDQIIQTLSRTADAASEVKLRKT